VARELSQLLLDEGIVSPAGLLRALTRQREAGGTLDTALLELGLVSETRLVGALARAADLPAAPLSAYERVDPRARRVFPSKVAERHGLAPFSLEGRELSLVATGPVDLGLLDEVSFMLSLHLAPHVGPEWRVRALIQQLYGGPLAPRLAKLAEQAAARGTSPGVVAAAPEAWVLGGPVTRRELPQVAAPPSKTPVPATAPETGAEPAVPAPARPPPGFAGFGREPGEALEPLSAALYEALETFEAEAADPPPAAAAVEEAVVAEPAPDGEPGTPDRSAPPGWTLAQARAALARAQTRDEVVVTVLRYARDFFQFATVFAVTRDAVAGHDGLGPDGDARDLARTVAIYASDPGIFRTTIETTAPYLGRVDLTAPGNQAVLEALGRGTPRTVLVTPILLRRRPVCLLYADNGRAPVSARRLGDLLLFCSTVGAAFERIIVARKGSGPASAGPLVEEAPAPALPAQQPPGFEPLSAAEAEFLAAGGQLEPEELFAPPPAPPRFEAPAPEAPAPLEPALEEPAAPETLPPEEPLLQEPPPEEPPAWQEPPPEEPPALHEPPQEEPPALQESPGLEEEAPPVASPVEEPPPELPPVAAPPVVADFDPSLLPEVSAEFALPEPEPGPEPLPPEPPAAIEAAPPEPPAAAPPAPDQLEPEPPADDLAWLVGSYLSTAPATPARASLLARLVGQPAAAPMLCELLPGPLDVAPEALATTPAAAQGPLFEALLAIGQAAVPGLLAVLTDTQPERRRAAAVLLGAIGDPATLVPLADRCLDPDPAVAEAAREALTAQRGTPAMRPVPERLRRALASGLATRAGPAARALMALRDAESIPLLIQALEGTDPATAAAAAEALAAITLQRHGASARQWLLWWKENRGRGRAEWLFGGLTAEDREVRAAAAAELERVAAPPVRYSPDMTSEEREPAVRAWASWFTRSGYRL
jgi:hypothetical protein